MKGVVQATKSSQHVIGGGWSFCRARPIRAKVCNEVAPSIGVHGTSCRPREEGTSALGVARARLWVEVLPLQLLEIRAKGIAHALSMAHQPLELRKNTRKVG